MKGFGLLFVAHGLWFAVLKTENISNIVIYSWWASMMLSAFITTYFSPRNKILLGMSMAAPAAILTGTLNLTYEALGNAVDFPGIPATLILVAITFPWNIVLCAAGSFAGYFCASKR